MRGVFGSLLARLEAGDRSLKRADFEALSDLSRAELEDFRGHWSQASPAAKLGLVSALAQMALDCFEYNFDRIFRLGLQDSDAAVKIKSIQGLWENEDPTLAGAYLRMVKHDADQGVRAAAAEALGRFVYLAELEEIDANLANAIETTLLTIIHNPAEPLELRRRAIEAVGFSCDPEVPAILREAYQNEDAGLKVSALIAMGRSADRRWRKIVLREVESPDDRIRLEAVKACGELEMQEAVPALTRIIDRDDDLQIRRAAVYALGQAGGAPARRVLERIIDEEDMLLYDAAQDALEELIFGEECPEIIELLRQAGGTDDELVEEVPFSDDDEDEDEEEYPRGEWDDDLSDPFGDWEEDDEWEDEEEGEDEE